MQLHTLTLFWETAKKYPVRLTVALINPALTVLIGAFAGPYIIAQLLGQLQAGTLMLETSWPAIILYGLTQLYGEIVGWRITLYMVWTFEGAGQRALYARIFKHLSEQSMTFHANRFGGSLVSQATKVNGAFERFWDTAIFQIVPVITSVIATVIILSFVFWQYAIFVAIISVIFASIVIVTSRFMAVLNTKEAQANTTMNARLADVVTNVLTVKAHGAENDELSEAEKLSKIWRGRNLDSMRGFLKVSTAYSSLIVLINMTALIAAVWAAQHHIISIAVVYLSITYSFTVARQLWEMNNIMRNYNRVMGDAHDMVEILRLAPGVQDLSQQQLHAGEGTIQFADVTFAYDGNAENILFDHFNLTIPAGEKVGLVGHSGSGKTSLTKLLLRFNDLADGEITIDGQNITNVTQASLRSHIAYVPQEPLLFHRSLRENIAYGRPNATEVEIHAAAKKAHAMEFIETLPQGFETMVGERGVKLSGGQRQRIAIARAILKDAPILVLDEATSALDSESEKLIQAALWELMKGRTSIVIAHRLSTIQRMDRIVVLEHGHIIEDGTHGTLLKKKGVYARLWQHQSGGFIDD
ncbi:MAG TPA: ABC transporter ATP-binding protein [Candidatus Saccharimonadales bacterium]|nr:ABC transporter ATP-binding protein [Candidatus Saccharimonadales bacterium]